MHSNDGDRPSISVIIPVLNGAATLGEQLKAVLGQDFPLAFEIVIADNGSTDNTVELVEQLAKNDSRIRLVDASSRPLGGAAAKNFGSAPRPFGLFSLLRRR